jgi:uncharacterized protein YndB with AHSA1/START domain
MPDAPDPATDPAPAPGSFPDVAPDRVPDEVRAVARTVDVREVDGAPLDEVALAQTFHHDIDDVWEAVTDRHRIARWFLPVTGDLADDGHFSLEGNASGRVLECDPPHRFLITWEFGGETSWVTVGLEREGADDAGTRFTLSHRLPRAPQWDAYGPAAVGIGWDLALLGLTRHLATGQGVAQAEGQAWAASSDGRAFMRHVGRSWGYAHAASGVDVDEGTALAAAERSIAAYTGEPPSAS